MKQMSIALVILFSSLATAEVGLNVDVKVTPMGSFKAKTNEVTGFATVTGDTVKAENIKAKVKNMKTGLPLRDKHMTEKYLEVSKYPEVILLSAEGKGGKGKGRLKIKDVEKDVEGTYKIEGDELTADFNIKLSDFGFKGIKYMGAGVNDDATVHATVPVKKADAAKTKPAKK